MCYFCPLSCTGEGGLSFHIANPSHRGALKSKTNSNGSEQVVRLTRSMPHAWRYATLPSETFSLAQESKFGEAFMLVFGQAADTALGLPHYMKIAPALVRSGMNDGINQALRPVPPGPPALLRIGKRCARG